MKLLVIGHYGSCNMGDRFQPFVIIDSIFAKTTIFGNWSRTKNIFFVNYSGSLNDDMSFTYDDITHKVYSPTEITKEHADLAILTTGSMSKESPYVSWVVDYIKSGLLKKIIIWGGFSRGNDDFESFSNGLQFLNLPNVIYFARSFNDFEIASSIKNNTNCHLSGDPMIYYNTHDGKILSNNLNKYSDSFSTHSDEKSNTLFSISCNLKKRLVVIPSKYAFSFNKTYWENKCNEADIIICIDTFADYHIYEQYKHKTLLINKPDILLKILHNTDHVISGRLHGAILSAREHIPTTMIITDDALPGKGSFKFDAVGNNSSAINTPLCEVITTKKDEETTQFYIPRIHVKNLNVFSELTMKSFDKIIDYIHEDIPLSKIKFSESDETSIYLLSKDKICSWVSNDYDYRNDLVSHCIFYDHCWEPYQTEVMIEIFKKTTNKLFIDVGSHIGYYSKIAIHFGLKVRAFEQNENIFEILCINLENNTSAELKNELVHQQSSILYENETVGLIKIDVEGGEPEIIDGLTPYISSSLIDCAIVEISPKFRSLQDLNRLIDTFSSNGYIIYDIGLSDERRQLIDNTQHLLHLKPFTPESLKDIQQTNLLFCSPNFKLH